MFKQIVLVFFFYTNLSCDNSFEQCVEQLYACAGKLDLRSQ